MIDRRIMTIPHEKQRYETIGDYVWYNDRLTVRVSDMENEDAEFAVGIHELIESHLCKKRGIPEKHITAFDKKFEKEVGQGLHKITDEPGDDKRAPYYREHQFATAIERMLCVEMWLDWQEYENLMMKYFRHV